MLCSLLAYDADLRIIATLDAAVVYDDAGAPIGLVDFAEREAAGAEHTDVWRVEVVGEVAGRTDAYRCGGSNVHTGVDGGAPCPGGEWRAPARGSKAWPEWLGEQAHDFHAVLEGEPGAKRLVALVHSESGYRRERRVVEEAIFARIEAASGSADIRDLVGGPERPLRLDGDGRSVVRIRAGGSEPEQR